MNEARVINMLLIGSIVLMFFAYLFIVQFSSNIVGAGTVMSTVSAFCG